MRVQMLGEQAGSLVMEKQLTEATGTEWPGRGSTEENTVSTLASPLVPIPR